MELMRTNKFETRIQLNSNFENYDIDLEIYMVTGQEVEKKISAEVSAKQAVMPFQCYQKLTLVLLSTVADIYLNVFNFEFV